MSHYNGYPYPTDLNEQSTQCNANATAGASFVVRSGKDYISTSVERSMSLKKKKKVDHNNIKSECQTNFAEIIKNSPPPVPPALFKAPFNRLFSNNAGKIKVIVKLKYLESSKQDSSQIGSPSQSFITVDGSKKQITVVDPPSATSTPRRMNTSIPKIFAFDAVYTDDDDMTELCSNALTDIMQAVVNGSDGCIFSFGHLRGVSSLTIIGCDQQIRKLGIIPCAISWLFRLIAEQKDKTGAKFSVRVSAIEVHGKQETLKDLLSEVDEVVQCSSGVFLREDPVSGTQLQNQSELRAPTAEKAAFYLDAALAARPIVYNEDDARLSHFLFTLHVYQYRVERGTQGSAVAGGRSRLHMLDFASGRTPTGVGNSHDKESPPSTQTDDPNHEPQSLSTALSLPATAAVLLALVNGQRHIPYRTSKLSQLLREAMGSLSCRTCMIAQVAMNNSHYADNMQIIQFASKMQRLKRRKLSKFSGTSSDESSCDSFGLRRASRCGARTNGRPSDTSGTGMTSSDADCTSSSDQSCDTVIYIGNSPFKYGDDRSSFSLRKRKMAANNIHSAFSKKSGSESDLTKIDISKHHLMNMKSSLRTNSLAWPKVAAKNAIETLSTQKEMWVDGPKAVFGKHISHQSESLSNKQTSMNAKTQTYRQTEPELPQLNSHSQDHLNANSRHNPTSTNFGISSFSSQTTFQCDHMISTSHVVPCHKTQLSHISLPISTNLEIESHVMVASAPHTSRPLVWDWIEKHSDFIIASPLDTNESALQLLQTSSKEDSQSSPQRKLVKHCSKHQQLLVAKQIKQHLNLETAIAGNEREGRKRYKSAKQKSAQVPFSIDSNFLVSPNNQHPEPAFTKVAEWIRSVSEETTRTQSLSPIRRTNKDYCETKDLPSVNIARAPSPPDLHYHSLDRRIRTQKDLDLSATIFQYSCKPMVTKALQTTPTSFLQSFQKENITSKLWQECARTPSKAHNKIKNDDHKVAGKPSPVKSNKNSPTRQIIERESPSKCRSSSLIKNALFGRRRLSSNNNIEDTNHYSVPNSPYKSNVGSLGQMKNIELSPLSNTGGYQYVVMTSSVNAPVVNSIEDHPKPIKKRPSSASPEKKDNVSNDKKQSNTQFGNKKDKCKEKCFKDVQNETKAKIKKEPRGRLSFLTNPLFGKRKDKDKLITPIPKVPKVKTSTTQSNRDLLNRDSPSKVISPYCTVTQPKHSAHSSSGHGSDCSSLYGHQQKYGDTSGAIKCREYTNIDEESPCLPHVDTHLIDQNSILRHSQRRGGGHTSSGYESIMRDDSTSESSLGAVARPLTPEKQQSQSSSSSSKQSHSAPNRSEETSEDTQSPVSIRKMSPKSVQKCQSHGQILRENEKKKIAKQIQFEKVYDLLAQQDVLKKELKQAKDRISVEASSWSFDLHVIEQMDPEDSSFLEALEKETDILRRRVDACKSHLLLLTYFDCRPTHQIPLDVTTTHYPYKMSHRHLEPNTK